MVDEKIKKILIFALPRSGTTIIQKIIAMSLFKIPNLVEPFNDPRLGFNPANPKLVNGQPADLYKWTNQQLSGVMKLLAINLYYVDVDKLLAIGNFDRVVIIERRNLVDCCISLCLAEQKSKYHYTEDETVNIDSFECSGEFVDHWIAMYSRYLTALAQIKNNNVPHDTIYYEDFMTDQIQYIAGQPLQTSQVSYESLFHDKKMISLNLPYKELCNNYQEVEEKLRKQLC
jgi:hypothetical protein